MPRRTRIKGHGQKGNRTRGRHKKRHSKETKLWNRLLAAQAKVMR